ncbi:MAG TPA: type II toxin-antitoxin system MqsA family antitoxin [Phycisphaerae bacterium]|nr:type II toxin-antitoxin system MqsA family antitoxin [Phycisphaerae bacterium]
MKKRNEFFEGIKAGLEEALAWAKGADVPVTVREVELPDPPAPMSPRQIARLRTKKVGVSQAVFAKLINSSVQTVHSWEQGRGRPSGPTLRFLRLLEKRPELVNEFGVETKRKFRR